MALQGMLRQASVSTGVAPVSFARDEFPARQFVSASVFGCALRQDGSAVIACNLIPGVLHSPTRNLNQTELRLATVGIDGRQMTRETGAVGRGVWFGASQDLFVAIGTTGTAAFVKRWGAANDQIAIASSAVRTAIDNGRFATGLDSNGRLLIIPGALGRTIAVDPDGTVRTLSARGSAGRLPPSPLVFQELDRFLILTSVTQARPPRRTPAIGRFEVGRSSLSVDPTWGDAGFWRAPAGFTPAELLVAADGSIVCPGWSRQANGVAFTIVRVAADGASHDVLFTATAVAPAPVPFQARLDAAGGLLVAQTIPHPLSVFLAGLPEMGAVVRWDESGQPDPSFGSTQGFALAQHLGYPTGVRGLATGDNGFVIACDRAAAIAGIDSLPLVFAFDAAGRPIPSYGEEGIVHHDDIPTVVRLHDGSGAIAAGPRRVWGTGGAADEFHLAVTALTTAGDVNWRYGSTNGMTIAPVVVNGQRTDVFFVYALARWGPYLAIGGSAAGAGFVTLREQDGRLLLGAPPWIQLGSLVETLEQNADGTLGVVYIEGPQRKRARVINPPSIMLDPAFPPTVVTRSADLALPDGSFIRANSSITNFPRTLRIWLTRVLPGGSIDATFGGTSATSPPLGTYLDWTTFLNGPFDRAEQFGAVTALPGGDYLVAHVVSNRYPLDVLPTRRGVLLTRWSVTTGRPDPAWSTGREYDVVPLTQVVLDAPDGILVVGATDDRQNATNATILRLRQSDGSLDPPFGNQGRFALKLRGDVSQTALPLLERANGTRMLPVAFNYNPDDQRQEALNAFSWLEIE